ncbi:flagellar biosynthetic protein FliO [Nitrosomonas sp.]|uniref:flagellar biosynthetic protein FliO n=1 Tax=Nitrosomonas sp. TaxID=42353 RepID=UPI001DD0DC5E|nr:flagellar biosynthetic protein FliO [Nitrosomonas sp.]MBX3615699.1 flagellar biosynthetic protein FliO [Nitrosomonas sp.]
MLNRFPALLLMISLPVFADTGKPSYVPPPSVISTENMLQMMGGLLLVLVIIGGAAWLLKRFSLIPATAAGVIKIVAASGVGQRERVVVVEIDSTWLVLGVAPGRVNKLHTMQKPSENSVSAPTNSSTNAFADQLNQSIHKEHV